MVHDNNICICLNKEQVISILYFISFHENLLQFLMTTILHKMHIATKTKLKCANEEFPEKHFGHAACSEKLSHLDLHLLYPRPLQKKSKERKAIKEYKNPS